LGCGIFPPHHSPALSSYHIAQARRSFLFARVPAYRAAYLRLHLLLTLRLAHSPLLHSGKSMGGIGGTAFHACS